MDDTILHALTGTRDEPVLTFRRRYRASVAELRDACTAPERLERWFGVVDPVPERPGDAFAADLGGVDDRAEGRLLECDADRILASWSWQGEPTSTIELRFEPVDADHAELVLQHALAAPEHAVGYGGGWEHALAALDRALGGTSDPGDDEAVEAAGVARWTAMRDRAAVVERRVSVPIERVWEAWTTEEGLRGWWWRHWRDTRVAVDPRVGGTLRFTTPSQGIDVACTILAMDAPRHLAATWEWADADGRSVDEAFDLRLEPDGDGTRVVVRHTGPWPDEAPANDYAQGWAFVLDALADVV